MILYKLFWGWVVVCEARIDGGLALSPDAEGWDVFRRGR